MILSIFSFSCPLILCSISALFTEYAGCMALFLEGLISFSAFLNFAFTVLTHSKILGFLLSTLCSCILIFGFEFFIERYRANKFIAGIAINLLLSALPSCLSSIFFGSRGVLTSPLFSFNILFVKYFSIIFSVIAVVIAILFLSKTQCGLYLRITGNDSNVLLSRGVNPSVIRILSWILAALYSSFAGCFLSMNISSFVPNISSGRGWMALAAVFLGKKKPFRILFCLLVFCCADFFAANIQNIIPQIPSSILISFPYLIVLCLGLVFRN